MRFISRYGLYFAWLLATFATLTSLYFSDVKHLEPCHLCWLQRIALFPLVPILGIACYRGFLGICRYVLPQVAIGCFIALYQVAIQEIPGWNPIDICGAGPSCTEKHLIGLGPISIPMLSLVGFLVLTLFLSMVWIVDYRQNSRGEKKTNEEDKLEFSK